MVGGRREGLREGARDERREERRDGQKDGGRYGVERPGSAARVSSSRKWGF